MQELEAQTREDSPDGGKLATNSAAIIAQKTCLSNLRRIDDAKQAWATENGEPDSAVPKRADLLPYLKGGVFPVCPSGGTYSINAVNEVPTCSFPGPCFPPVKSSKACVRQVKLRFQLISFLAFALRRILLMPLINYD